MSYEFYLDLYFLENLIMNLLALHLAAETGNYRKRWRRLFASAAMGAAGACILVISPIHKSALSGALLSVALCFLMAYTAFRCTDAGQRRRCAGSVCVCMLLLGGTCQILSGWLSLPFAGAILTGYPAVLLLVRRWKAGRGQSQYLYEVCLQRAGKTLYLTGLLDSGNRLTQPGTSAPVHIIELAQAKRLLDAREEQELAKLLRYETEEETTGKFTYIPFRSIGKTQGVLPAFWLDSMEIKHGESAWSTNRVLAAVSDKAVSSAGEYQMILHPQILE